MSTFYCPERQRRKIWMERFLCPLITLYMSHIQNPIIIKSLNLHVLLSFKHVYHWCISSTHYWMYIVVIIIAFCQKQIIIVIIINITNWFNDLSKTIYSIKDISSLFTRHYGNLFAKYGNSFAKYGDLGHKICWLSWKLKKVSIRKKHKHFRSFRVLYYCCKQIIVYAYIILYKNKHIIVHLNKVLVL